MKKWKAFIAAALLSVSVGAKVQAAELDADNGVTIKEMSPANSAAMNENILFNVFKMHSAIIDNIQIWNQSSTEPIHPAILLKTPEPEQEKMTNSQTNDEGIAAVATSQKQEAVTTETNKAEPQAVKEAVPETDKPSTSQEDDERVITVKATAYTASCEGCSGITAAGIDIKSNPDAKVIAVDPDVIPLGSKVYVEGYGEAVAADTGSAIKGDRIDVFIPSEQEALNWGNKQVTVKILN